MRFGFSEIRFGALICLPPSYFAHSSSELASLMPARGFENFLNGKTISENDLNEKLDDTTRSRLNECLVLSADAKLFGTMRELVSARKILLESMDKIIDLLLLSLGYSYSYSVTRKYKMNYNQRRNIYIKSILLIGIAALAIRTTIPKFVDKNIEIGK